MYNKKSFFAILSAALTMMVGVITPSCNKGDVKIDFQGANNRYTVNDTPADKFNGAFKIGSKVNFEIKPNDTYKLTDDRQFIPTDPGHTYVGDSQKRTLSFTVPNYDLHVSINPVEAGTPFYVTFHTNGGYWSKPPHSRDDVRTTGVVSEQNRFDKYLAQLSNYGDPTTDDKTFDRWNTHEDGTGDTYKQEDYLPDNDRHAIDLYAIYVEARSTITFDPNGGSWSRTDKPVRAEGVVKHTVSQYLENAEGGALGEPTREYMTFDHWSTSSLDKDAKKYYGNTIVERKDDFTLYAIYKSNPAKISFDPGEGHWPGSESKDIKTATKDPGQGLTIQQFMNSGTDIIPIPELKGGDYKFAHWIDTADTSKIYYLTSTIPDTITIDNPLNLKAVYQQQSATVTFIPNGGKWNDEGDVSEKTIKGFRDTPFSEFTAQLENPIPKHTDPETFLTWNTKNDGTGEEYKADTMVRSENITVYAIYKDQRTKASAVFELNGGTIKSGKLISDVKIGGTLEEFKSIIPVVEKRIIVAGEIKHIVKFKCWTYTDSDGNVHELPEDKYNTFVFDKDITTFTAKYWSYNVTIDPNGGKIKVGSTTLSTSYTFNNVEELHLDRGGSQHTGQFEITAPDNYLFNGIYVDENGNQVSTPFYPERNITLKAVYTGKPISVVFYAGDEGTWLDGDKSKTVSTPYGEVIDYVKLVPSFPYNKQHKKAIYWRDSQTGERWDEKRPITTPLFLEAIYE